MNSITMVECMQQPLQYSINPNINSNVSPRFCTFPAIKIDFSQNLIYEQPNYQRNQNNKFVFSMHKFIEYFVNSKKKMQFTNNIISVQTKESNEEKDLDDGHLGTVN